MTDAHAATVTALTRWTAPDPSQAALAQAFLGFLAARPDACSRSCAPGHVTASAVVFSHDLTRVALVLHGLVGAWLQPGGHLEPTDADPLEAARREVREELGLTPAFLPEPVTLDCHLITCRGRTSPTRHYDVRYAARVQPGAEPICSAESRAVRWWPVDALPAGVFGEVRDLVAAGLDRFARA